MHTHNNKFSSKIKRQLANYVSEISLDYQKPQQKFIHEMLFGLLTNQSCRLSEIARALKDKTKRLKIVHNRLQINLKEVDLKNAIEKYQTSIKGLIEKDTVLSVDLGDLTKRYAKKMEHLERVYDGNALKGEPQTKLGYWLLQVVGVNKNKEIFPILLELFSLSAKGGKSLNTMVTDAVEALMNFFGEGVGIFVFDRGCDAIRIYEKLLKIKARFIIRLTNQRDFILEDDVRMNIKKIVRKVRFDYTNKRLMKLSTKNEHRYEVAMGTISVCLPGYKERLLLVVLKKIRGKEIRMCFLTTEETQTSSEAFEILRKYLCRWGVEDAFRYVKQSYNLEDIRLRNYSSLQNMVRFILLTFGLLCKLKHQRLNATFLNKIVTSVQRFCTALPRWEFLYYALSNGISQIFSLCKYGISWRMASPKTPQRQLFLQLTLVAI